MLLKVCSVKFASFAIAVVVALAACTTVSRDPALVNAPFSIEGVTVPPETLNAYLADKHGFTSAGGAMRCAYTPLGQSGTRLFVWSLCMERGQANAAAQPDSGSAMSVPAAFTIQVNGSKTQVVNVELPEDGSGYEESLERIFPSSVRPSVNLADKYHQRRLTAMKEYLQGTTSAILSPRDPARP